MIQGYQNEIAGKQELHSNKAAKMLTEISALFGNVLEEIRVREIEYNKVLLRFYESEETANRAKIKAECSKEYENKIKAKNTEKVVKELIASLKYYLREKESEKRESKNMAG